MNCEGTVRLNHLIVETECIMNLDLQDLLEEDSSDQVFLAMMGSAETEEELFEETGSGEEKHN